MPHIADTRGILRENLMDAGCGPELIARLMALAEQGNTERELALLAEHRKHLLERCHAEQKRVDCLDYLVHQIEKK